MHIISYGQFVTILSLIKTRTSDGRGAPIFYADGVSICAFLIYKGVTMTRKTRNLAHAALIAALYAVLTHLQNIILPNSASMAIQCRLSEALCVLAFFTPAAIPGLTMGCLVFNITFAGALPLDWLVGSLATVLAAALMWQTRHIRLGSYPLLGMVMPALTNAVLVGWELTVYIGGGFLLNAWYIALGELIVMLTLGTVLLRTLEKRGLARRLFSEN